MNRFISVNDVPDPKEMVNKALALKNRSGPIDQPGKGLTLGLLFMNPSLRTRMSTQVAAQNLGFNTVCLNAAEGWKLETDEQVIMNNDKAEHIIEAAGVMSQYCDIIGVRCFPGLKDRAMDYEDAFIEKMCRYASVPVISLESAIRHPLQSLADLITIHEHQKTKKPKIVLSWAPHPKALPQAVPNSFAEWTLKAGYELTITHPSGYGLADQFTKGAVIEYDQKKAFEGADFVYAKNWSSYSEYGKILCTDDSWMITKEKMLQTNNAKFMHCLPVRRNVVVADEVLDSPLSLVLAQAKNRIFAAQVVLAELANAIKGSKNGAVSKTNQDETKTAYH